MIYVQYKLILLCFFAFSLAIPFPPSHHTSPSNSTANPLPSTSYERVPSITTPSINLTSTHLSEVLATNHTTPPQPDASTPDQSQWSPGDIGTIIFGCIASILAVLGLYLTLWLARGGSGSRARYNAESGSRLSTSGAANDNVHLGNHADDSERGIGTEEDAGGRYQGATGTSMAERESRD